MTNLPHNISRLAGRLFADGRALSVWTVTGLLIPNIALAFTEGWTWAESLAGILLPGGVYILLQGLSRRAGLATWLTLPVMVLGAFQIVLLYLYGRGLIAVDMFLNVFTTSFSEATALLRNLVGALCAVSALYVTALAWGAVALARGWRLPASWRRGTTLWGGVTLAAGVAVAVATGIADPAYDPVDTTFPLNVCDNLLEARERTRQFADYAETSRHYSFHARSTAPARRRELYIIVVGETSRGENWQLGGYPRPTNPRLGREPGLIYFPRAYSESNTTHKSVPMILSAASAETFDTIYRCKSLITAFKEAGYHTAFISNQTPNRSYTQFFGDEADLTRYIHGTSAGRAALDTELLPAVRAVLDSVHTKQLIVLHTYGSHFLYSDRYPRAHAHFTPDDIPDAEAAWRPRLINAYDNSIRYTDLMLSRLIEMARAAGCRACVIYASDHGEDIFDDKRGLFLHASPLPTARQLHVGALCWLSDSLRIQSPAAAAALGSNARRFISPQQSYFHTLMDIARIETPLWRADRSLASGRYTEPDPLYLTDRNEAVPWSAIPFAPADTEYFRLHGAPGIPRP